MTLAWLRAERVNLLACLDHATRTGDHARVVALTSAMAALLRHDGPWGNAITRHQTAVSAAQRLGDRPGEADALIKLGALRHLTGSAVAATEALRRAQAIYRDLGEQLGQANALTNLGAVWRRMDDYPAAVAAQVEALGMYRDLGDLLGRANALNELGAVRSVTGDFPGAVAALDAGLALYRDLGDVLGQADNLKPWASSRTSAIGAAKSRFSTNWAPCTGSRAAWPKPGRATPRRCVLPGRSAAPGMRRTHWPAWAAVTWPQAIPRPGKPGSGRRTRCSSG